MAAVPKVRPYMAAYICLNWAIGNSGNGTGNGKRKQSKLDVNKC